MLPSWRNCLSSCHFIWHFFIFLPLPQMTDMAVQYLTSGSQYLRELDVSGCVLLTDLTLWYLERICPPLSSITMACCSGISRYGMLLKVHSKAKLLPKTWTNRWRCVSSGQLPQNFSHVWHTGSTAATPLHTGLDTTWGIWSQNPASDDPSEVAKQ